MDGILSPKQHSACSHCLTAESMEGDLGALRSGNSWKPQKNRVFQLSVETAGFLEIRPKPLASKLLLFRRLLNPLKLHRVIHSIAR